MRTAQQYLDIAEVMLLALDAEGRIVLINRKGRAILGYEEGELIGRSWFNTCLPAPVREKTRSVFRRLMQGEIGPVEYHENPVLTRSGEVRTVAWHNALLTDDAGSATGTLSSGQDITDRKRLEEQLRQATKMEAVGRVAGGIAHDFNNLLTAIRGYSELALAGLDVADPVHGDVLQIKKSADRAASLVHELLTFSRRQFLQPTTLHLSSVIREMAGMLRSLLGEHIELVTILDPGLGTIEADPGGFEQVIMNLALNANDAMPEGGQLTILTENADVTDEDLRADPGAKPGPCVVLTVRDTGHGMDKATVARIFEPFFSTKPQGQGTGLGLATVYGIVKQSGGAISVETEPGQGTTFRISLPRT